MHSALRAWCRALNPLLSCTVAAAPCRSNMSTEAKSRSIAALMSTPAYERRVTAFVGSHQYASAVTITRVDTASCRESGTSRSGSRVQLRRHATASTPYTPIGFLILVLQNLTHLLIAPFCELFLTLREGGRLRAGSVVDGLFEAAARRSMAETPAARAVSIACLRAGTSIASAGTEASSLSCVRASAAIYRVCWHGGQQRELRARAAVPVRLPNTARRVFESVPTHGAAIS
eukprot:scaffold67911_cov63-Phaeocystis_antarctica.AAC.2